MRVVVVLRVVEMRVDAVVGTVAVFTHVGDARHGRGGGLDAAVAAGRVGPGHRVVGRRRPVKDVVIAVFSFLKGR